MSRDIEIRIAARTEGMEEVQSYGRELKTLAAGVADASEKLSRIDAYQKLAVALDASRQAMQEARYRAQALGKAMEGVEKPTAAMRTEYNQAVREAEKAERIFGKNETRLAALGDSLSEAEVNTGQLESEQRRLTASFEQGRTALARTQAQVDAYGTLGI